MLLKLDKPRDVHPNARGVPLKSCKPFFENSRAVLIHRPRRVTMHKINERYPSHLSVENWCGNTHNGRRTFTFLDAPPSGKIVCARCEEKAVEHGLPPSSEIAGHHIHTGGVIAVRHCCLDTKDTK